VIVLSASTQGFLFTDASILERGLLFVGALALLVPGMMTDGLGLVLLGAVSVRQYLAVGGDLPAVPSVGR
jgi:UPF0716 family protein affecting phage T7 exclusion